MVRLSCLRRLSSVIFFLVVNTSASKEGEISEMHAMLRTTPYGTATKAPSHDTRLDAVQLELNALRELLNTERDAMHARLVRLEATLHARADPRPSGFRHTAPAEEVAKRRLQGEETNASPGSGDATADDVVHLNLYGANSMINFGEDPASPSARISVSKGGPLLIQTPGEGGGGGGITALHGRLEIH